MKCLCGCGRDIEGKRKSKKFVNDAHKQAYWRKQHEPATDTATLTSELEEARARVAELEQEVTRLLGKLDVERRFREDHDRRGFKSWLKKQPAARVGDVERRILSDDLIPAMGSRALYEAHLRKNSYTADDIERFRDLWKLMLLS